MDVRINPEIYFLTNPKSPNLSSHQMIHKLGLSIYYNLWLYFVDLLDR